MNRNRPQNLFIKLFKSLAPGRAAGGNVDLNVSKGGIRMKKIAIALSILGFVVLSAASAHADLNSFLAGLNLQAKADMEGFSVKLSNQFDVSLPRVETIITRVEEPADAFMCLQLGEMADEEPERVVQTYRRKKGKGWGAVAKELGIKPGSAEFHALKRGDFELTGEGDVATDTGQTKGKDKSKNKGKGKGKGK